MLKEGDMIPEVALQDSEGREVRLSDLLGPKSLVLYFYPKDDTMVCTKQATLFRDHHASFVRVGAEVIGISADDPGSHQAFAEKHELPFRLLTDPDGAAQRAFGIKKSLGLVPGRVTFVADHRGRIRHVFSSQLRAQAHVDHALGAAEQIAEGL